MTTLVARIQQDIKDAMRAQDKQKLTALRMVSAAFKQIEIDERISVDDVRALQVIDKLTKQRKDSIQQFQAANRADLVEKETYDLTLLQNYLPVPLTEEELTTLIQSTIQTLGATSIAAMGQVMTHLKPLVQGRCDMGQLSARIKAMLS